MKISKTTAYALMLAAAVFWGTSGTLTVLAVDAGAEANEIAVFAAAISVLVLLPIIGILDPKSLRIRRSDFLPLLVFGTITGSLFSLAWYNAVDLTSVTTAVILLYLYPSIVTIASLFFLNEKLTRAKAVALPLTFVGALLVSGAYDPELIQMNAVGIALGLFTAVAAAIYYLWGKKFLVTYSANTVALYLALMTVPGLLVITGPAILVQTSLSSNAWFLVVLIGVIPGTAGYVVSMFGLKHIEASKASIVASLEPIAAVALAFAIVSERVEAPQMVGVALGIAGVLMLRVAHKEESAALPDR